MKEKIWLIVFGAVACNLSACSTEILPLALGTSELENSTQGLVFGRIEIIRAGCKPKDSSFTKDSSFKMVFGWWLTHEESGKSFVVRKLPVTGHFVLNLPAGRYRVTKLIVTDGCGVMWKGNLPARFMVKAGEATYLGTWIIRFSGEETEVQAQVIDQLPLAQRELSQTYTGHPIQVSVVLLESPTGGRFSRIEERPSVD